MMIGTDLRIEQDENEVHLIFISDTVAEAVRLIQELSKRLSDGNLAILFDKPTKPEYLQ